MSALRFRRWMPLLCGPLFAGLALAGCAEEPSSAPKPGSSPDEDPPAEPEESEQRFDMPIARPGLCSRTLPAGGETWKLHDGPPQAANRREVAASAGASFVLTDRTLKRALHGESTFETVRGFPGQWLLDAVATANRLFV